MTDDLRTISVFDDSIGELLRDNASIEDVRTVASARQVFAKAVGPLCEFCGGGGVVDAQSFIGRQRHRVVQCGCVRKAS